MTLLVRVALEMIVVGLCAPALTLALGRHRWHRAGWLGHPAVGIAFLNGTLIAMQSSPVVGATGNLLAEAAALGGLLVAAVSFWWPVLRPHASGGLEPMARIGYLFIAGVPPTIPGVVLAFSRHVLYPAAERVGAFGLTPIADQQLAGLILFGTAKAILVTLTFVILWQMLTPAESSDDGWDEAQPAPHPSSPPAWYRHLEEDLPSEEDVGARVRPMARDTPSVNSARGSAPPTPAGAPAPQGPAARRR